jgi:TRAP-type C4-dicarboxylate transport system permease small subunit
MEKTLRGLPPRMHGDPIDAEPEMESEDLGDEKVRQQTALLPAGWRALDRTLISMTRHVLFVIGGAFTLIIVVEVVLRYAFSYSMSFANPLSKLLLVWFFLLGAGIALRQGAHMGFELIAARLAPRNRRRMLLTAHGVGLLVFMEMLWASVHAMGPAMRQTDPGLDISLLWLVICVPMGFVLLTYHMVVIVVLEWRKNDAPGSATP